MLGKDAEPHRIVIEGGAESIKAWVAQVRSRAQSRGSPAVNGVEEQTETPGQTQQTQANTPEISSTTSLSPAPDTDAMET